MQGMQMKTTKTIAVQTTPHRDLILYIRRQQAISNQSQNRKHLEATKLFSLLCKQYLYCFSFLATYLCCSFVWKSSFPSETQQISKILRRSTCKTIFTPNTQLLLIHFCENAKPVHYQFWPNYLLTDPISKSQRMNTSTSCCCWNTRLY